MSQTTTRLPLADAVAIADELVGLISDACEKVVACGSIRRKALTCGDIDLVAIPKIEASPDLFGEPTIHVDLLDRRMDELWREGVIAQRINARGNASWGTRSKRGVYRGLNLDVNAVNADTLGAWMVIRTGPAAYSHSFVMPRDKKRAIFREGQFVGYRYGILPPGFEFKDGFRLHRHGGFVPTTTEESVFEALGLPYLPPEHRR